MLAKEYRKRAMVPLARKEIGLDVQRHKGAWLWGIQAEQVRKQVIVILECFVEGTGLNE